MHDKFDLDMLYTRVSKLDDEILDQMIIAAEITKKVCSKRITLSLEPNMKPVKLDYC